MSDKITRKRRQWLRMRRSWRKMRDRIRHLQIMANRGVRHGPYSNY